MYTPWNDRWNTRKRKAIAIGAAALLVIGGSATAQAALSGNKIGLRVTAESNLSGDERLSHATLVGPVYIFVGGASTAITQVKFWIDDGTGTTAPAATAVASPFALPFSAAASGGAAGGTATGTTGTATSGSAAGGMAATPDTSTASGSGTSGSGTTTGSSGSGSGDSGAMEDSASGGAESDTGGSKPKKQSGTDSEAEFTANATKQSTTGSMGNQTMDTGGNGEDSETSASGSAPVVPDATMSTETGTMPTTATGGTSTAGTGAGTMPAAGTGTMPAAGNTGTVATTGAGTTGAAATGTAGVFDTTALADGSHFVLAEVTTSSGVVDLFARFTVQNGSTTGTAAPTATAPAQPKKATGSGTGTGTAGQPGMGTGTGATPAATAGSGTEAATLLNWGTPIKTENMDTKDAFGWYDSPGHEHGNRSPDQASAAGGILTLTGANGGKTAGGAHDLSQQYGRWEVRQKVEGESCWRPVLLLWPTAENWPVGGEVDYAENGGGNLNEVTFFLHYGASNSQTSDSVEVDMTQWHNYAVEWTADHIRGYVDGKMFFEDTDKGHNPPGPMHATVQLDASPGCNGNTKQMIDWMKIYKA